MINKKTILIGLLFVGVFLGGVISGALIVSLTRFPPSPSESIPKKTLISPQPAAGPRTGFPASPQALPVPPPPVAPAPQPGQPPEQPPPIYDPRTGEPRGPGGMERNFGPGRRSEEFREARRGIFTEGREPDWSQFEGQELEILKRAWGRYLERQQRRGANP